MINWVYDCAVKGIGAVPSHVLLPIHEYQLPGRLNYLSHICHQCEGHPIVKKKQNSFNS